MKIRKVAGLVLLLNLIISTHFTFAQAPGCPDIDAGPDQSLVCSSGGCTTLNATAFLTGETTDYTVSSISYAPPFPFTGGGGTQIFINEDDVWSNVINLPFNFCFYGNMYNKLIVGANGVLSFDLSLAGNWCEFSFSASIPTPGPPPGGIYNNSINGAYHDIDPSVFNIVFFPPFIEYPADINYAVLGSAPCRTFVINYSTVPHYDCNSLETTQQIVLYETTNVIEVYIKDKPTCTSWNDGNAVIGLQNINGTKGITAPGRNTGPWTAHNEAWRFTPSGTSTTSVEWFDAAMNSIGTGTILPNICPAGTTTYTARATYQACDGTQVVVDDQVTVTIIGGFTAISTHTDETCAGACNGTITVNASGGTPPFSFDIGSGAQAAGNFMGLCAGNYVISVADAGGCNGTLNVTIDPSSTISVSEAFTDESCLGQSDGTITLVASGGTSPYTYNISFGPANSTGIFTGLPANIYNYSITDSSNCTTTGSVIVNQGVVCCNMTYAISSTDISCNGACDGTITITQSMGYGQVEFSIDNGINFQTSGTFANLCAGNYDILLKDSLNCLITQQITLAEPAATIAVPTVVDANCGCDGLISVAASGGAGGPYEYSLDGGNTFQTANAFTNVCAGGHVLLTKDASGCTRSDSVSVGVSNGLSILSVSVKGAACHQSCDGEITITATGAVEFSIDSGNTFQAGNIFPGLCAGVYDIAVSDGSSCLVFDQVTVTEPDAIALSIAPMDVLCASNCDGSIEILAGGGTAPFQYSNDAGLTFQTGSTFSNLCAGNYNIVVTDFNGCSRSDVTILNQPDLLELGIQSYNTTCFGTCDGFVEFVPNGGTAPFSYQLDSMAPVSTAIINNLCAGTYNVIVTDFNSCTANHDFTIHEPPLLIIDAGETDSMRAGESTTLMPFFNDSSLLASIHWTPPTGLSCNSCNEPEASPSESTLYTLTAIDNSGCIYTDTVRIVVYSHPLVNIPNAFTPNGDLVNDEFLITGMEISDIHLLIFNRWGEKLYESTGLNEGWNGYYRGKLEDPGVYIYWAVISYLNGEQALKKGSITLLR